MPVSPVTGRLDAFQWKVPLAELGEHRATIDAGEPVRPALAAGIKPPPPPEPVRSSVRRSRRPSRPSPARRCRTRARRSRALSRRARRVEAVIPLVHVPDDPGPEPEPEPEPELPEDARRRRAAKSQVISPDRSLACQRRGRYQEADNSAAIAQLVEHVIRNDGVGGSNPSCGTTTPETANSAFCGPSAAPSAVGRLGIVP